MRSRPEIWQAEGTGWLRALWRTSDWMFAAAYARMLAGHDRKAARRLRKEYMDFTARQTEYLSQMYAGGGL